MIVKTEDFTAVWGETYECYGPLTVTLPQPTPPRDAAGRLVCDAAGRPLTAPVIECKVPPVYIREQPMLAFDLAEGWSVS